MIPFFQVTSVGKIIEKEFKAGSKSKSTWKPTPHCKASAEKKTASRAVRQEKGNLLEGKEMVTGP